MKKEIVLLASVFVLGACEVPGTPASSNLASSPAVSSAAVSSSSSIASSSGSQSSSENPSADNSGFVKVDGITYMISEDQTSCYVMAVDSTLKSVEIPDVVNGLPVISIYSSAFASSHVTTITLPSTMRYVGESDFDLCVNLKYYIEDGMKYLGSTSGNHKFALIDGSEAMGDFAVPEGTAIIGEGAFQEASNLTAITIPSTVVSIGDAAFIGLKNLTSVSFASKSSLDTLGEAAFFDCPSLTAIALPSPLTKIQFLAFDDCSSLATVTFPETLTTIEDSAFYGCEDLSSIVFPSALEQIGNMAFEGCFALKLITEDGLDYLADSSGNKRFALMDAGGVSGAFTVPEGTKILSGDAFSKGKGITSLALPSSLEFISDATFLECGPNTAFLLPSGSASFAVVDGVLYSHDLKTLWAYPRGKTDSAFAIPEGTETIGGSGFSSNSLLKTVTLPASLESIGGYGFQSCSSLTTVTIPAGSALKIIAGAFAGCTALAEIDLPDSLSSIGAGAFSDCSSLTSLALPSSILIIESDAFNGCASLSSFTIPASTQFIGMDAFSGCTALHSIIIPLSVWEVGNLAFTNEDDLSIYCEATSEPLYYWDYQWNDGNGVLVDWYSETKIDDGEHWHYVAGVPTIW